MGERRVILIVDDNTKDRLDLVKIWHKDEDYEILQARDCEEALAILAEGREIDLVLLDIIRPETAGIELLVRLKQDKENNYISVVVNTQPGENTQVEKALELGAEDFIVRPYNIDVVRDRVGKLLSRKLQDRDELTDIYTSSVFNYRTKKMLLREKDKQHAVLFFSVNGFPVINEFYGIKSGDIVLKEIAKSLAHCVGRRGTYGRIVADNFICCIPVNADKEELDLFDYMEEQLDELESRFHFKLNCGIYRVEDVEMPMAAICDRAKFALMNIEEHYGKRYAYYNETNANQYKREQRIINDMERALKEHQFFILLQPIYDAYKGRPTAAEALVRWQHPELGMIPPGDFIPVFEKTGFICQLDLYVFEEACKLLAAQRDRGEDLYPVSVNVSRIDMYKPDMADKLEDLVKQYDIERSLIRLEITETAYTERPHEMIELVNDLRQRGFEILMDDFGSGQSSINMLKELPIDTIKIDMHFMSDLSSAQKSGNILLSIIRMAKLLHIDTMAEGVETQEQLQFLKNAGCNKIQGYYFSKPLPQNDYVNLMKEQKIPDDEQIGSVKGILIVEDSRVHLEHIKQILGDTYKYYEAATGMEALEKLRQSAKDIHMVITDIFMPEMDGFEFLRTVQANALYDRIPIVAITGNYERENVMEAFKDGAIEVVEKPIEPIMFRQQIKNLMRYFSES